MCKVSRSMIALLLFVSAGWMSALAQVPGFTIVPDDRYDGYTGAKIEWPTTPQVCGSQEYYEPRFTNLARKQVNVAGTRVQDKDECPWMLTSTGWNWVLRRAGTKVAVDAKGRDLFDLGRADGKVCGNPRMNPPAPPPPAIPVNGKVHVVKKVFEIKNQQRRPPAIAKHTCPTCGEVSASQDLDNVVWSPDLRLGIQISWPEVARVKGVYWQGQLLFNGPNGTLIAGNFGALGTYDMDVIGEDSEGDEIVCGFSVTILPPPFTETLHPEHHSHKKAILIVAGVACGASLAASWYFHVPVPPCGWFRTHLTGAKPAPGSLPGGGVKSPLVCLSQPWLCTN